MEIKPNPKPVIWHSPDYRKFISQKPCYYCGASPPNDPHHLRWIFLAGVAVKPHDSTCSSACRKCHSTKNLKPKDKDYEAMYWATRKCLQYLTEYLIEKGVK